MHILHLLIFILLFFTSLCQSNDQLTQAKQLLPEDMLISEGGNFALGFSSPTNSNKSLYIGIWYHNIPDRTVVWVANRDNPITSLSSTKLTVTNRSELVLSDSKGHTVWTTKNNDTTTRGPGAFAVLRSTGNFVLQLPSGTEIWRSFDHPTDTIPLVTYKEHVAGRHCQHYGRHVKSRCLVWSGVLIDMKKGSLAKAKFLENLYI